MVENASAYRESFKAKGGRDEPSISPKSKWVRVSSGDARIADTTLETLATSDSVVAYERADPSRGNPIECPCCRQSVRVPSLAIVIDHFKVTPLEARILGAIWKGKGHPVQTERIFDAMYADDPDGGPSPTRMYAAFKVALCHLRVRLNGSGVSIKNVGYRRGYRLVIGA